MVGVTWGKIHSMRHHELNKSLEHQKSVARNVDTENIKKLKIGLKSTRLKKLNWLPFCIISRYLFLGTVSDARHSNDIGGIV